MKEAIDAVLEAENTAEAKVRKAQEEARIILQNAMNKASEKSTSILQEGELSRKALHEKAKKNAENESVSFSLEADKQIQSILHINEEKLDETARKVVGRILYGNS